MQIGNPSYKKCPHCGQQIAYYPGPYFIHHYEFTEWSDGETFEELPCLKNTYLQKCNLCNEFYWFTQKLGGMSFEDYVYAAEYFENKYSIQRERRKQMAAQITTSTWNVFRTHSIIVGKQCFQ
jgi:hypothetical protein